MFDFFEDELPLSEAECEELDRQIESHQQMMYDALVEVHGLTRPIFTDAWECAQ